MAFVSAATNLQHSDEVQIRVTITGERGVSLSELGLFLLAINSGLNEFAAESAAAQGVNPPYVSEMEFVHSAVTGIQDGSYVFDIVASLNAFVVGYVAKSDFLASMLANAGYELTKKVASSIRDLGSKFPRIESSKPFWNTDSQSLEYIKVDPVWEEPPFPTSLGHSAVAYPASSELSSSYSCQRRSKSDPLPVVNDGVNLTHPGSLVQAAGATFFAA